MDKSLNLLQLSHEEDGLTITDTIKLGGHDGIIRSVCIDSSEIPKVISAGQDSQLKIWDSSTSQLFAQIKGFHSHVYCARVLSDNNTVYTVGQDPFIQQFDLRQSRVANKIAISALAPMNYISFANNSTAHNFHDLMKRTKHGLANSQSLGSSKNSFLVAHQDGTISQW